MLQDRLYAALWLDNIYPSRSAAQLWLCPDSHCALMWFSIFWYIFCRNTDWILIPAVNTMSALWFTCLDYSQKKKEKEILPGFLSTLMQPVLSRVPGPIKLKPFVSSIFRPDFLWAALSVLLWPIMSITAPELSLRISGKKPLTHLPLTYSGRDQWLIKRPVWFNAES